MVLAKTCSAAKYHTKKWISASFYCYHACPSNMRKKLALLLLLVILSSLVIFQPATVKAEPKTIVVPDNYPTIAQAIGNASNGDTILVKSGDYQEHTLNIGKSLTLKGEDRKSTKITNLDNHGWNQATEILPPVSYAVNVTADNVKISGFTITNATVAICTNGKGILLTDLDLPRGEVQLNGSNQTFANNTISFGGLSNVNCIGSNNYILNNTIDGGITRGILVYGSNNVVYGNKLRAVNVAYDGHTYTNQISASMGISGNSNFVASNQLQATYVGISGYYNTVCGNTIENGGFSILGNNNTFYANTLYPKAVTDNSLVIPGTVITNGNQMGGTGISMGNVYDDASNNLFYQNNFYGTENAFEISIWRGAHGPELFDNGKIGNYWSNYTGTDSNGDGIGDTPYVMHKRDPNHNDLESFASLDLIDNYPVMLPIDISTVNIQLPSWANTTVTGIPVATLSPSETSSTSASPTQSPSPSPTIPELSWLVIIPLVISMFSVALMLRHRKTNSTINRRADGEIRF